MKVWITRAEPGASETAERVRALRHEPLVAPLLAVRPLPFAPPDRVGALAFTSRNGVSALAGRPEAAAWLDLPVFAVGDATAAAARAAGFDDVRSADGDAAALAALVARSAPTDGPVLHLRAREPAAELAPAGVEMIALPAYEAVDLPPAEPVLAAWPELEGVLLHSPRAARALARAATGLEPRRLLLACISEAAAAPLRDRFERIRVAARPTEAALLAALGKAAGPG